MLEERDRRALEEIEQRLATDDPELAGRLSTMRAGGVDCRLPLIPVMCGTVLLSLPFVALFLGPTAALVTADVTALLVVLLMVVRHVRRRRS